MKISILGSNWDGNAEALKKVVAEFSALKKQPVILKNPHGVPFIRRKSPGKTRIFFWAAVSNTTHDHLPKAFGDKLMYGTSGDAVKPSENPHITHIRDKEGRIVAEFDRHRPNNLYVLYDLPHQKKDSAARQFRKILERYIALRKSRSIKAYFAHLLTDRLMDEQLKAGTRHSAALKRGSTASRKLIMAKQKLLRLKGHLASIKRYMTRQNKLFAADLDKLQREATVRIDGTTLKVSPASDTTITFYVDTGLYDVTVGQTAIPFWKICNGPAKAGLAQFIGQNKYYAAFKIIESWLKANHGRR
jgi:hypothetical protein